ncbi:Methyltransferase type 11 [Thioalkalivibrio sulfidiphilus HL-EbGr7]|uniref:Methyltransferase type 11 n=1 Tax=Thioalkalivibrio sulfidiphilus (strain HL-EbGR7) TaxID=396588 RepID=B8GM63_THISH|nr:methyltransferase domain-containing protein [Thioalkalivibrio sulfidiphilus]ACL73650.1 Methyltransferase type 11 [Thioalkalivibrio sulfidiphilus HL-EbGr7]
MNQTAQKLDTAYDPERAQAFADRIAQLINDGAVAVMISLGHRAGLFEALASLPPSDSHTIARRAGLAERYVREWLAALVTGGIVDYDPATRRYALPGEHGACLTRDAPLGNLAVYAQHVALMGQVQDHILERFRSGDGTRYEDYPCFHHMMAEDSGQTVVAQLFEQILPLVPGLRERLERGIAVLDAGCGRGEALIALARHFPESRFTGYDLCSDAIEDAARAARDAGLDNLSFGVRDLTDFDEQARYDLVTSFDAVHDQKAPADLIRRLHRSLRSQGTYLMQDIGGSAQLENNLDFPMAAFLYAISCVHCTPVSLGQGGEGLGTMWGWETAEAMLMDAGFDRVTRHVLPHDPMNVWFVSHKG